MIFTKLAMFAVPALPYMVSYLGWIETCLGLVSTGYGGFQQTKSDSAVLRTFDCQSFHFTFKTAIDVSHMPIVGEQIIMVGFTLILVVSQPILVSSRYGKCFLTLCCYEQYVCSSFLRTWQRKAFRHIPSESRCYEVVTIVPLCRRCFDFALRGGTGWSLGFHLVPYMST